MEICSSSSILASSNALPLSSVQIETSAARVQQRDDDDVPAADADDAPDAEGDGTTVGKFHLGSNHLSRRSSS